MSTTYDTIIIGSGPAGYTAAIYCVRAGLLTLILEGAEYGGQLMNTIDIENYPGFADPLNGYDLMMAMRQQCQRLGCTLISDSVISVKLDNNGKLHSVHTKDNNYKSRTVIIATGATAKKLDIPSGDLFWNHGISACAVCDGALPMYRNKALIVVGGGDTACEEAIFLSRFASCVYMLVRTGKMRASHRMKEKVLSNPKITILYFTEVVDAIGTTSSSGNVLTGVKIINTLASEVTLMPVAGLFYAIGHTPNTAFLAGVLETDSVGYLVTENTKTAIPGVFACGDVQDKVYRQAITAAGSGCIAALEAERYLHE